MRTFEELLAWAQNARSSSHLIEREAALGFLGIFGEGRPCGAFEPPIATPGVVAMPDGAGGVAFEFRSNEARWMAAELLRRADEVDQLAEDDPLEHFKYTDAAANERAWKEKG